MKRMVRVVLRIEVALVVGGLAVGLWFGVTVIDLRPAIFGWLFGAGAGLSGGAFLAAIITGQQLVSGPPPSTFQLEHEFDDAAFAHEIPRLLDDLPPRARAPGEDPAEEPGG